MCVRVLIIVINLTYNIIVLHRVLLIKTCINTDGGHSITHSGKLKMLLFFTVDNTRFLPSY